MVSDDRNKQQDDDRGRLLEEIRRRAEEAELKRIEEEERAAGLRSDQASGGEAPSPFPSLPTSRPTSPHVDEDLKQRVLILRERLAIAFDRKRPDKARELLVELEALDPMDPSIADSHDRLVALQEELAALPAPVEEPPEEDEEPPPPLEPAMRPQDVRERVATLFESAQTLYEQERYEQALHMLDQLLLLDSANDEALEFHQRVERARQLAEVIRSEEERHKAEQPVPTPVTPEPSVPTGGSDADFWGSPLDGSQDAGGLVSEETPALPRKSREPWLDRITGAVAKIRIPVKPLITGAVAVAAALVGYVVVSMLVHAVAPPERVLLVTPPVLISGGLEEQHRADALTDDLLRDLGSVPQIRVLAAPTVFAVRGQTLQPARLARVHGAGFVLALRMQIDGDVVSGTVVLSDTLRSAPVWQTSFEAAVRELPRTRVALARRILEAMEVSVPESEDRLKLTVRKGSSEGYGTYLRGRAALLKGGAGAADSALVLLRQAVREDSTLGDAWVALGWAAVLTVEANPELRTERIPFVLGCVQRAIALGARGAETFRVWALAEFLNVDYRKSVARFTEAVELSPSDAEAARRLAIALTLAGRTDDAVRSAADAVAVDPLNPASHITAGLVHQFRGEFREAASAYSRAVREDRDNQIAEELYADVLVYLQRADDALALVTDLAARMRTDPAAYYRLGRVAQTAGRPKQEWMYAFERARTLLNEHLRSHPDGVDALSLLALTQTRLGSFKDALAANARALQIAPEDAGTLYAAARMYALQRDKQQAIAHLNQAIDIRYDLRKIVDMDLFNLRADEDFVRTVTR